MASRFLGRTKTHDWPEEKSRGDIAIHLSLPEKDEGARNPKCGRPLPPTKPKNQEAFGLLPQLSQHLHFWPHLSAQHLLLQQAVVVAQDDFVLQIEAQPARSDVLKAKDRNRYFMVM